MIVNLASAGFWDYPLAKVIFAAFMLSAMLMMGLYSRFGFEKILGMGHILWPPLFVYVLMEIPDTGASFRIYLIVWSVITAISLVFDVIDLWKYFASRKRA